MTHDPAITTDVFEYLCGDGLVMVGHVPAETWQSPAMLRWQDAVNRLNCRSAIGNVRLKTREVWSGIEDDVRDLERLLK